jgi:hypothetical protein
LVAAASAIVFILLLPTTPRSFTGEEWIPPLGVKPLGDDAHEYLSLAEGIRSKHEYSLRGKPTRMRPPIYPLFLAGVQSLFGANIRFVQAIQALLVTGTVAIFFFLARRVFDTRVSFLATLLLSLYIPWTVRAALIMSEALFIFLMLLSLYLLIVAIQEQKSRYYGAAGAVLALASLTRPITLLLPVLLIAILMISGRRQTRLAHLLRVNLFLALAYLAVLLPWGIRNAVVLHEFTVFPSSGGVNLWVASHPDWRGFVRDHMAHAWRLKEFYALQQDDYYISSEADKRFYQAAAQNIKADPRGWLFRNSQKLARVSYYSFGQELWNTAKHRALTGQSSTFLRVLQAATFVFILLAVLGLVRSLSRRECWAMLAIVMYFFLIQFVSFAEARYMLPIVPFYILFATYGLSLSARALWRDFRAFTHSRP